MADIGKIESIKKPVDNLPTISSHPTVDEITKRIEAQLKKNAEKMKYDKEHEPSVEQIKQKFEEAKAADYQTKDKLHYQLESIADWAKERMQPDLSKKMLCEQLEIDIRELMLPSMQIKAQQDLTKMQLTTTRRELADEYLKQAGPFNGNREKATALMLKNIEDEKYLDGFGSSTDYLHLADCYSQGAGADPKLFKQYLQESMNSKDKEIDRMNNLKVVVRTMPKKK